MYADLLQAAISAITVALGLAAVNSIYRRHLNRKERQERNRQALSEAPEDLKRDVEAYREQRRRDLGLID